MLANVLLSFLVFTGCAQSILDHTIVTIDPTAVHTLPATFLSFTVDAGQLFDGVFWNHSKRIDFGNPALIALTSALAPAVLRVGGTDADRLFYNMSSSDEVMQQAPPAGFKYTLNQGTTSGLFNFAAATGVGVVFGLNGGPGPRLKGVWQSDNAQQLVSYVCSRFKNSLAGWQLGNEPNLYLANFKFVLESKQLVEDFRTLRELLTTLNCTVPVIGPDVAEQIVPAVLGRLPPTIDGFLSAGGAEVVDAISYHWYPLDGNEATKDVDPFYATQQRATSLKTLTRGAALAQKVEATVSNRSAVWSGETALAAFGGQASTSQTWAGVFFWADAIGTAARMGQQAIVRQTLCGARYGLIDPASGCSQPNPDYWIMVLWKRLMGSVVLRAASNGSQIRAYAGRRDDARVALMLINLGNSTVSTQIQLAAARTLTRQGMELYLLAACPGNGLDTQRTMLNGEELIVRQGRLPVIDPVVVPSDKLVLTPYSVAFVLLEG